MTKQSIHELIAEHESDLRPILTDKLEKSLKSFGIADKERRINFRTLDYPATECAYLCYQILKELSASDITYFERTQVIRDLYKSISSCIKSTDYLEKAELTDLKLTLKSLDFAHAYHSNNFGFHITGEGKFGGYIFDDSMGSALTKVTAMVRAKREFEHFALAESGSIEFDFKVPSKERFDEYPYLKDQFMSALESHSLKELQVIALEYGFISSDSLVSKPSESTLTESKIFGDQPVGRVISGKQVPGSTV